MSILLTVLDTVTATTSLCIDPESNKAFSKRNICSSLGSTIATTITNSIVRLRGNRCKVNSRVILSGTISVISSNRHSGAVICDRRASAACLFGLADDDTIIDGVYVCNVGPFSRTRSGRADGNKNICVANNAIISYIVSSRGCTNEINTIGFCNDNHTTNLISHYVVAGGCDSKRYNTIFVRTNALQGSLVTCGKTGGDKSTLFTCLDGYGIRGGAFTGGAGATASNRVAVQCGNGTPSLHNGVYCGGHANAKGLSAGIQSSVCLRAGGLCGPSNSVFVSTSNKSFRLGPSCSSVSLVRSEFTPSRCLTSFPFNTLSLSQGRHTIGSVISVNYCRLRLENLDYRFSVAEGNAFSSSEIILSTGICNILSKAGYA